MSFTEQQKKWTLQIDRILEKYLPECSGKQKTLLDASCYSVMAGGKRLRPMLLLLSYRMCGGKGDYADPFAAAVEMIHTQSLVHDDLPAMDNDMYRRGRKTTHVVYGEAMAILAGDALLNYAYETAALAFEMDGIDIKNAAKAMSVLAKKTGIYGMIGGQSVDVEMEGKPLDMPTLDFIYELKTAALIEAPLMIGAILAGADDETVRCMEDVGRSIGLAFQIRDDILDVTGSLEKLGKNAGSDEKNNKTTYASIVGTEKAAAMVDELTARAARLLDTVPGEKDFLKELLLWMAGREN